MGWGLVGQGLVCWLGFGGSGLVGQGVRRVGGPAGRGSGGSSFSPQGRYWVVGLKVLLTAM